MLNQKRKEFILNQIMNLKEEIKTILDLGSGKCEILLNLMETTFENHIEFHCLEKNNKLLNKGMKKVKSLKNFSIDYHFWNANFNDLFCKDGLYWYPTNFDLLILCEVIEHLPKDILNRLKYFIFNLLQPKYVLITTPIKSEFIRDFHVFEYTKENFSSFCSSFENYTPISLTYLKDDICDAETQICILKIKEKKEINIFEYDQETRDKKFKKFL